jgi:hypothetical protein
MNKCEILHAILFRFRLQDHIVKECPLEHFQAGYVRRFDIKKAGMTQEDEDFLRKTGQLGDSRTVARAMLAMDFPNEEDLPTCDVLSAIKEKVQ